MDLLKKLNEDAAGGAVGAGSVGGYALPLFATFTKIATEKKKKRKTVKETFDMIREFSNNSGDENFDDTEVVSKLKSLERKSMGDSRGSVSFGLEDSNGGLVRVSVQADQAEEFERALQAFLADENEDQSPEIAEILFKMRNQYNILDVQWPEVEEDQEETQLAQPEGDDQLPADDQQGTDGMQDVGGDDDSDVKSLLGQVIDMMKADADARKADAVARQKEAEMKSAECTNATASAKVKREEELLDMDTYYKDKKTAERESKQLAKLAQWKQEVGSEDQLDNNDIDFGPTPGDTEANINAGSEEEELTSKISSVKGKVHPSDIADFILKRIK